MKKTWIIALALVLALGSLGVAYAMWSDNVFINTNIATGRVGIAITNEVVLDEIAPPPYWPTTTPDYTCNDHFVPNAQGQNFWKLDKNVAWGNSTIYKDGDLDVVTLYNTYPSNFNMVTLYVRNTGTIPIKIWKTEILDANDVLIGTMYTTGIHTDLNMDDDADYELEIQYGDNFGTQLEPGNAAAEISYWIHTMQPADQNATYTFKLKIYAVQYNEYQPGPIPAP